MIDHFVSIEAADVALSSIMPAEAIYKIISPSNPPDV